MTTYFAGLFRRLTTATRLSPASNSPRPDQLPAQPKRAVEVKQDGNFLVIHGEPDPGSLVIERQGENIVVNWITDGERQSKSLELYKIVHRNGQRSVVSNIAYVEISGGRGRNKFWSQAKITSYF